MSQSTGHPPESRDARLPYRPDIDGLRAVAVLLVLLFHSGLGAPGGFIGVDVFFVISGYLMTALLLKDRAGDPPHLRDFYARRIRRIIPAATAMVIAALVAGYLTMLPEQYVSLAKSAIAQQMMLSNVYFWRHTGYFDGAAELMPLLHTWSLAVEEQFYLAYPLLPVCMRKFRQPRNALAIAVALLTATSLAASLYGTRHHPSATFYLLPSRAWELLLGGVVCLIPPPRRIAPWMLGAASTVALTAILTASAMFSKRTLFPGTAALMPCLATAVLIYANQGATHGAAALLASRPIVAIGLMSYSLYLWHWPILAFARLHFGIGTDSLPPALAIACLAATVAIAYVSWRWIESPFRRRAATAGDAAGTRADWVRPVAASVGCALAVCAGGAGVVATDGVSGRFPPSTYPWLYERHSMFAYRSSTEDLRSRGPILLDGTAGQGALDFLVWGDSHAMAAAPAFESLGAELGLRGAMIADRGTPPCFDVVQHFQGAEGNRQWCDAFKSVLASRPVKLVVLVARWSVFINPDVPRVLVKSSAGDSTREHATDALAAGLRSTIRWLTGQGIAVVIVLEVPRQEGNPVERYTRGFADGKLPAIGISLSDHQQHQSGVAKVMGALQGEPVTIIPVEVTAFDADGRSRIGDDEGPYYLDQDHLSPHGARQLLAPLFRDCLHRLKPVP